MNIVYHPPTYIEIQKMKDLCWNSIIISL